MSSLSRANADREAHEKVARERAALERKLAAKHAQQDAQPDVIPRAARTTLVAGNAPTRSVRQREEDRLEAENPEVLTAPTRRASAGTGVNDGDNTAVRRTRDRVEAEQAEAQVQRGEQPTTDLAAWYAEQHKQEQAQIAQWEREKQEAQARVHEENEARGKFNERMLPVRIMLDERDATDYERTKIWDIAVKRPDFTIDRLYATLLELRQLAAVKTDWKLYRF